MSKQEIEAEYDRCMAMSDDDLLLRIFTALAKPGTEEAVLDAIDYLAAGIKDGNIKLTNE